MRCRHRGISVIAGIAVFVGAAVADPSNLNVSLTVLHDGRSVALPGKITITVDGTAIEVSIVNGAFAVPAEASRADHADVAMNLGGEEIRIKDLRATMFEMNAWKLMLADRRYEDGYQSDMLPGVAVRRTCILLLDSPDAEGVVVIVDKCRSKSK
jgi:hypothetical protein